ncbi:hypothetical protein NKH77_47710 [Streptomyces sp. M19]
MVKQQVSSCTPRSPPPSPRTPGGEGRRPSGGDEKVKADSDQIAVDGKTLKAVIVSNSTGVTEDQIDVGFEAGRIDGRWYMTDMSFSFG